MDKLKHLLIVFFICFILAGLAVLLCLLDPTFEPDKYHVVSMVIIILWAFFIVPSVLFIVKCAYNYFGSKSDEQAFRSGVCIGVILGFSGLVILCLFFSFVMGPIWFVQSIREIALSAKQKKQAKSDGSDIFDI